MNSAILLHGKPTRERYENPNLPKPHDANWFKWLALELESKGIPTNRPAMPKPYFPVYGAWKNVFQRLVICETTGIAAHSAGSEFVLRFFSEHSNTTAEQLALVAPYCDKDRKYGDFSQYELARDLGQRIARITIISSLDDSEAIQQNAHRLATAIPEAELVELNGFGHFMIGNAMSGPEFPELLEVLTSEVR